MIENVALCGHPADEILEASHMRVCPEPDQEIGNAIEQNGSRVKPEGDVLNPDRVSPHVEANVEHCNNRTGRRQGPYRVESAAAAE
ncbi:hypothetical protein [Mesorhizobium sp.]|uniref:hypothetical protein n=1 Tax=Mesorhizobium sp. TaxID=1871066 RepID=UPI0025F3C23F|nr:hypothetical protein [Mesorhizobium sp.]